MQNLAFAVVDKLADDPDRVSAMMRWGDQQLSKVLMSEAAGADLPDHALVVRDAAGRRFSAMRLERQPNTNNFTLVLLTEDAPASAPPEAQ